MFRFRFRREWHTAGREQVPKQLLTTTLISPSFCPNSATDNENQRNARPEKCPKWAFGLLSRRQWLSVGQEHVPEQFLATVSDSLSLGPNVPTDAEIQRRTLQEGHLGGSRPDKLSSHEFSGRSGGNQLVRYIPKSSNLHLKSPATVEKVKIESKMHPKCHCRSEVV